jgi:hypothetical protein
MIAYVTYDGAKRRVITLREPLNPRSRRPRVESARPAGQRTSVATACNTRNTTKCRAPVEYADKSAHANNETRIPILGKIRSQYY